MAQDINPGTPYATGGGGFSLEREYAASGLASLLLGQPIDGLGNEFRVTEVSLQQGATSPVDDVIVVGHSQTAVRTLRAACRRRPRLVKSDASTVDLFVDYLSVVRADLPGVLAGTTRLALVVAGPYADSSELGTLTEVARRQPHLQGLRSAITAVGAYSVKVRSRFEQIVGIADAALAKMAIAVDQGESLLFHLLSGLFVIESHLEGDVASGKTSLVARLQTVAGDPEQADSLRRRLVEIAAESAIRAGGFTRPMLRAELRSFGLIGAAPDFATLRSQVDLLESELRLRTPSVVPVLGGSTTFSIDRSALRDELVQEISAAPAGSTVLVHGEADVGKSALTLAVVDAVRAAGGNALLMSLRDLPAEAVGVKAVFGVGPAELLASASSGPEDVVVLDGAEDVQERGSAALASWIAAIRQTGKTAVVVVRDDGLDVVEEVSKLAGVTDTRRFLIPPLTREEIETLVNAVPVLKRWAADHRAVWLLRRVGLVELLAKAAASGAPLPNTLSSEADVFAIVWRGLIRANEQLIRGVSPDDRDNAVVILAHSLVNGPLDLVPNGAALASLRSDGVLLSKGPVAAWSSGDRFWSDVLRDFSVARLFVQKSLQPLLTSNGPRWTVRSARLYAQARLAEVAANGGSEVRERWAELRQEFATLSKVHGSRWAELPWEALLTAGFSESALSHLTAVLLADPGQQQEAVRSVLLRFSTLGASDPIVAAPLVGWLTNNTDTLTRLPSYEDDEAFSVVLHWLRGVGRLETSGETVRHFQELRRQVRDALVQRPTERQEKHRLEALGLLGADANGASKTILSEVAADAPGFLACVVESPDVASSLAQHDAIQLCELAEAFYTKMPRDAFYGSVLHDDGVRGHESRGLFTPAAAWYLGPFWSLLSREPRRGIRLINRLVEKGVRGRDSVLDENGDESRGESPGIELDILGLGPRQFIGDSQPWSWYRGSSVGPYPCMSALLALELALDDLTHLELSPKEVALAVLEGAKTLAEVGLVFGFLVRHFDDITDELDGFLASQHIWELEFGRVFREGQLHVQGKDHIRLANVERRRWAPNEIAMRLVVRAGQKNDSAALERLREVGRRMIEAAGGATAPPKVVQWATSLDAERYVVETDGDRQVLRINVPKEVSDALATQLAQSANLEEAYRLWNRYRPGQVAPYRPTLAKIASAEELANDYRSARDLERNLVDDGSRSILIRALAGVAAAVVQVAANGNEVPDSSVDWALPVLVTVAGGHLQGALYTDGSFSPDGADRQAALALPLVLLDFASEGDTRETLDALAHLSDAVALGVGSGSVELRNFAVEGLRPLYGRPCRALSDGRCWHESVWTAVETGARTTILGERFVNSQRHIEPIVGDVIETLARASVDRLMLSHLATAAIASFDAGGAAGCLQQRAVDLGDALLQAVGRAASLWAEHHYQWRDEYQAAFASAVLRRARSSQPKFVLDVTTAFAPAPEALGDFLHALMIVATHEPEAVPQLVEVWPSLMEAGLKAGDQPFNARTWRSVEKVIRGVIPSPTSLVWIENLDAVCREARNRWFPLSSVVKHVDKWLVLARGEMSAVDAMVGFLRAQTKAEQVSPGLDWVRQLVVDKEGKALTCGFLLVSWLTELRDTQGAGVAALPSYRAIVDALVLGDYSGARDLQRRDE